MKGWLLGILLLILLLPGCIESPTGKVYQTISEIPYGYAPPWNIYDNGYFLNVTVGEGTNPEVNMNVSLVAEHADMYFYNTIYVSQNVSGVESWKAYNVTEANGKNWTLGKVTWSGYQVRDRLNRENWILVYACENRSDGWDCGCVSTYDTVCNRWSIQHFPNRYGPCDPSSPTDVCYMKDVDTPFCDVASPNNTFVCVAGSAFDDACVLLQNTSCLSGQICVNGECINELCDPTETAPCYTGETATRGVGVCSDGNITCDAYGHWGTTCVNEVLPSVEDCTTTADEDCDGLGSNDPECVGYTCSDSDNGKNYTAKGGVNGSDASGSLYQHNDSCNDISTLTEWYCEGGVPRSESHTCAVSCRSSQGKCVTSLCGNGIVEQYPEERCELGDLNLTINNGTANKSILLTKVNNLLFNGTYSVSSNVVDVEISLSETTSEATFSNAIDGVDEEILLIRENGLNYTADITSTETTLGLVAGGKITFAGPILGGGKYLCHSWNTNYASGVLDCNTDCYWDKRDCSTEAFS